MKLLHIDSSILGGHSKSRHLTAAIVAKLKQMHPQIEIVYRDLAATPPPHMTLGFAARGPPLFGIGEPARRRRTART